MQPENEQQFAEHIVRVGFLSAPMGPVNNMIIWQDFKRNDKCGRIYNNQLNFQMVL